jgi:hypothetical protein
VGDEIKSWREKRVRRKERGMKEKRMRGVEQKRGKGKLPIAKSLSSPCMLFRYRFELIIPVGSSETCLLP